MKAGWVLSPQAGDIVDEAAAQVQKTAELLVEDVESTVLALGPELVERLHGRRDDYDVVCFFASADNVAAEAISVVRDRALLVLDSLQSDLSGHLLSAARVLVFGTPEDRSVVERRLGNDARPRFVIEPWVDLPLGAQPQRFREAFGISGPYLACPQNVESSVELDWLLERLREVRRSRPDLSLVLLGRPSTDSPETPGLVVAGSTTGHLRHDALAGATAVLIPSPDAGARFAALEGWSHGRPTLATAASDVVRGASARSNGGLWYTDEAEFRAALALLIGHPPLAETLGIQGKRWVEATSSRERVRRLWLRALEAAAG
jgi:glycosyltransferase involved in cell wall biosynthesis